MKIQVQVLSALALLSAASTASATHKNWLLKDPGTHCSFESASASSTYWYTPYFSNQSSSDKWVACPVSVANRFSSSGVGGYSFTAKTGASAMWANVYVNSGSTVTCQAVAQKDTTSIYYSPQRTGSGSAGKVALINTASNWGGGLESNETQPIVSLNYECILPAWQAIAGYKTKLCQRADWCDDTNGNDNDVDSCFGNGSCRWAPVQTSAIECMAENPYGDFRRNETGIQNYGTVNTGEDYVNCPITPPADDSYEHPRDVRSSRVYISPPGWNGCAAAGACPQCRLEWIDKTGAFYVSNYFEYGGPGYVEQQGFEHVSQDVSMTVQCQVPPGQSVLGVTSEMTVTRISGGI